MRFLYNFAFFSVCWLQRKPEKRLFDYFESEVFERFMTVLKNVEFDQVWAKVGNPNFAFSLTCGFLNNNIFAHFF